MTYDSKTNCVAFGGDRLISFGSLDEVAAAVKRATDADSSIMALVFDANTSDPIDLDLRGTQADVLARLPQALPRGPGRPKLGVTAREITLLPRHWDWLASQAGGASVALRKLVEQASKRDAGGGNVRLGQNALYKFVAAIAGNFPSYEEAIRALFAGDRTSFIDLIAAWPADIQAHILQLANAAFLDNQHD
jgi:uncharacterized protein